MSLTRIIDPKFRERAKRCALFLIGVVLHCVYVVLVSMLLGLLPDALVPNVYGGASALGPFPPFTIGVAIASGIVVARFFHDRRAVWAWVPSLLWLLLALSGWNRSGQWLLDNFFTNKCGETECVYELMYTVPFVISLSYAVSSCLTLKFARSGPVPAGHFSSSR